MSENKTMPTGRPVRDFLASVEPERRRDEGFALLELFERVTGISARMWGPSIVGFGKYHYRYESGREGDACLVGFSPRKAKLALYILPGFEQYSDLLAQLGPHSTGVSCLYLTRLDRVNIAVLEKLISLSLEEMKRRYPDHDLA